jgi:TrmH family RNA methyltransferase
MAKRLRRYKPSLPHSYALGVRPTLELLTHCPEHVTELVVGPTWERNEGIHQMMEVCERYHIEVIVSDRTLARISRRSDCWAAGVFRKYTAELRPEANHLVLVGPRNMGNVGTAVRTMVAYGVSDLAIVGQACDVYDPRVVRASMGALFGVRFRLFGSLSEYLEVCPPNVYCLMLDGQVELPDVKFRRPHALVFGNEGEGLPEPFRSLGTTVRIPQSEAVDSLNLGVAVGIALYAACEQRT